MFQQEVASTNELSQILTQELDSFKAVLQFSEKIASQVDSLPISVLYQMVEYRQKWIEKIQRLEAERSKLQSSIVDETSKQIIQDISELAQKLVKIDEKIYRQLRKRKNKFVKEHADLISARRNNRMTDGYSRVMDIIQE